jgi:hypothetical protein
MSPRRAEGFRALVASTLALTLAGCSLALPKPSPPAAYKLPPGRVLVVARAANVENKPTAEMTAEMLLNTLRGCSDAMSPRDLQAAAGPLGLGEWASGLSERLQRTGWPSPDEDRLLGQHFGIRTVVSTEITSYEQVWGKYAKFTRTGIEARGYDTGSSRPLWRLQGSAEVEDMAGRAFQHATEQAVQDLSDALCPRHTFSLNDLWRSWRR